MWWPEAHVFCASGGLDGIFLQGLVIVGVCTARNADYRFGFGSNW